MAAEYSKVLKALGHDFIIVGRGEKSAQSFFEETGVQPIAGGLNKFLETKPEMPSHVIAAVGVDQLAPTTLLLLNYGVKSLLLEKPAGLNSHELSVSEKLAKKNGAIVVVAYNRRFYSSVLAAEKIIVEDGGVTSFNFEFTEWANTIKPDHRPMSVFNNWLLANSTHVIDTAFFLGGWPKEMTCFHKGGLEWHPSGSIYSGAGISEIGALFSYQANWEAPGRWVVEILTQKHRLYFKPMETLQIQVLGSVKVDFVETDDHLDKEFKPGLYLQTKAFLDGDFSRFCTIEQQKRHIEKVYNKMNGYEM